MDKSNKEETHYNSGPVKASTKLHEIFKTKITKAIEFASKASIYSADVTATELNTAQSILLSLMHSLIINDLSFCVSLLELANSVEHLRSSYLPTWLRDDFNFDDQQVLMMISRAALFVQSGFLIIPTHILKVLVSLSQKYRVVECCRTSGNTETLKFLSEFNLPDYSRYNQSINRNTSFPSNPMGQNRSNGINILPTTNTFWPMEKPFHVPQSLSINSNVQKSFAVSAVKQETFEEGAAAKQGNRHNMNTKTINNLLDDDQSSVERIENPSPSIQEVWVETSATASAQTPDSTDRSSSNELYVCAVREYLKVPDDFNEEELLNLITYSDTEGRTPLHRAAKDGNPYVVECMLMLGAKVNEKDTFGSTPSHCAASVGNIPILQVLAQNRADFSLTRNDGCTPLHEAVINGHEAACRWLLDHHSEINAQNSDGWTPLHLAAQWNKHVIAKILLDNGADSKIYNNNGKTPVDVAREEGHTSIVQLLFSLMNH